ncbi:MAG: hypothetical protein RLY16_436 [Bacteroidota bacterium]|jgi:peroxiredoxin
MKKVFTLICLSFSLLLTKAQVRIGSPAPEIALPDTKDSVVKLSNLKGQVVIVDFWASWCGPCRAANPHMVALYNKFKDKGLVILGVSIDDKPKAWKAAIKKDKLPYLQVIDPDGWSATSAAKYGVEAIPATFLIDQNGLIAAIDEELPVLEKKVAQLLKL